VKKDTTKSKEEIRSSLLFLILCHWHTALLNKYLQSICYMPSQRERDGEGANKNQANYLPSMSLLSGMKDRKRDREKVLQ
jgi:hypothetical protein